MLLKIFVPRVLLTAPWVPLVSYAQCDRIENDFFESVADLKQFAKKNVLVVLGKVVSFEYFEPGKGIEHAFFSKPFEFLRAGDIRS